MPLDRRGNLRMDLVFFVRPLDDPSPHWCEEHGLPCRLEQQFVLTRSVNGGPEEPIEVVRGEGHQ